MKTLLRCSLLVTVAALSAFAVAEDGFDQTPLYQHVAPTDDMPGDESEAFSRMLERQPAAAGSQTDEEEPQSQRYRGEWPEQSEPPEQ